MTRLKQKDLLDMKSLDKEEIELVLQTADSFKEILTRPIKKVPTLRGKSVALLFYEPSTRTRTSFEMAAKTLSADTTSIAAQTSSVVKGESFKDTLKTLEALGTDILVLRHQASGAAHFAARYCRFPVINGGDGFHEHPTQGLLDLFTLREKKKNLEGLTVTIVGDIAHSRVARSNIWGLTKMGAKVRLCGPLTLLPKEVERFPAEIFHNLDEALEGSDAVMMLRLQLERQSAGLFPSIEEYARLYGLTLARLSKAKKDVLVMHPGPMNRGIEIDARVADGIHSVIEEQVTNGVAVRMALLYLLLGVDKSDTVAN